MAGAIVSRTLKSESGKMKVPFHVAVEGGQGFFFGRIGLGSLSGTSGTMTTSWGKTGGTIKNGGEEMMAPFSVAIEQGWGEI